MDFSRYVELDNDDQIIFFSRLIEVSRQLGCGYPFGDPVALMSIAIMRFSEELVGLRDAVSSINRRFDGSLLGAASDLRG
jgi:hypothetical protein